MAKKKLLLTKHDAIKTLGVSEKAFRKLLIPFVAVGKRKYYMLSDLERFVDKNRRDMECQEYTKGKPHATTGTALPSTAVGIEGALEQIASQQQRPM